MLRVSAGTLISLLLVFLLIFELKDISIRPLIPFGAVWQILIIGVVFILSLYSKGIDINKKSFIFLMMIFLFYIWSLFVSLGAIELGLSLQRISLLFFITYLVCVSILSIKDTDVFIVSFFGKIIFCVSIVGVLALIVNFFGTLSLGDEYSFKILHVGPFSFKQAVMGAFLRTGGYFGNPNSMSKWVVFLFPFLFMLYHFKVITKLKLFIVVFVFISMLIIALSRAGMGLAFISSFLYWYFYSSSYTKKLMIQIFGVIIASSAVVFFIRTFGNTSRASFDLNSRDIVWGVLWQNIEEKPLTGVGFGVVRESILKPNNIDFATHNFYVEKLAEVGLIGLILALIPFLYVICISYKNLRNSVCWLERSFNSAALSFLFTFFLYLNFETGLFVFSMWHIFIIIVSALVLSAKYRQHLNYDIAYNNRP